MCRARGTVGATPKGLESLRLRIRGVLKGVLQYTWVALEAWILFPDNCAEADDHLESMRQPKQLHQMLELLESSTGKAQLSLGLLSRKPLVLSVSATNRMFHIQGQPPE